MKVKEVVKQVAMLLQLYNLIDANFDDFDSLDDQSRRDVNIIVSSINEVLCDISTDYLPLTATEEICVFDGVFDTDNLAKDFYKLIKFGNDNPYRMCLNNIVARDGIYKIEYNYLPEIVEFEDEISHDKKLTKYALSYGVAMEYCLICGNYPESEMWESKFKNAMQNITSKTGVSSLKARRW